MLIAFEAQDVAEVLQLTSPDEAATILTHIAFEPIVAVTVVEQFDVAVGSGTETILEGYVVEEGVVLVVHVVAGRNLATHDDTQAVVPKPLGELERVVGVYAARCVCGVVHAKTYIKRAKSVARYGVDLAVEERA